MPGIINIDLLYQIIGKKEERIELLTREMALIVKSRDKEIKELGQEIEGLKQDIKHLNEPDETDEIE